MTSSTPNQNLAATFRQPLVVLVGILLYLLLAWAGLTAPATVVIVAAIALGSYRLVLDILKAIRERRYALDYLAMLAITVALVSNELLVAGVIALMLSTGTTLEAYGVIRARQALTGLADRLPSEVVRWQEGRAGASDRVELIVAGDELLVRKGEVIALDGVLLSESGLADESSLTGEPYEIEKVRGDPLRSGTVNIGEAVVMRVTRVGEDSTYRRILRMVEQAQREQPPLVRLADRYSALFTVLSLGIAAAAYLLQRDLQAVLAVLVIATPCPLILATPIALLGGVSSAARHRIIVKQLAALETLARVDTLIFDKTGTITLGRPALQTVDLLDSSRSALEVLGIAEAIERSSLHPIAKAVVAGAHARGAPLYYATDVREQIGVGIEGTVDGHGYSLARQEGGAGITIGLRNEQGLPLALLRFEEETKPGSHRVAGALQRLGFKLFLFTGDREVAARVVAEKLGADIVVRAECSPADKMAGLSELKRGGSVTAMIGDGINDAPALAEADVGLVFASEEQTASSEAADIVLLDGDLELVEHTIRIARRTVGIALQSILWGIGLSIVGMLFAAAGYVPPLAGAFLQEAIDVAVILNALRASRQ